jgi:gliding motility-associated-like protein
VNSSEFLVTIYQPLTAPVIQPVVACGSYALPALSAGAYYSQPGGVDPITDTTLGVGDQTVYVYLTPAAGSPCAPVETSFTVSVTAAPVADTFPDVTLCQGQSFTLPTPSAGNAFYTQAGGAGTALAPGSQLTQATQVFVYAAPQAGSACQASQTSFTVGFAAQPESTILGGCQGNAYVLTATPVNYDGAAASYSWTSSDGQVVSGGSTPSVTVSGAGTYTLTVTVSGCDGSTPFVAGTTSCTIQKGISANNDGMNDFFDLDGFNVSRLEIFNRYGTKVYERRNYVNEWKGQSDKGDELPDGTYYYVIERRDGEPTKTGWIYINRKN